MTKTMRKQNLKIQILAGNTLMSRFHVGFEIELPLVLAIQMKIGLLIAKQFTIYT